MHLSNQLFQSIGMNSSMTLLRLNRTLSISSHFNQCNPFSSTCLFLMTSVWCCYTPVHCWFTFYVLIFQPSENICVRGHGEALWVRMHLNFIANIEAFITSVFPHGVLSVCFFLATWPWWVLWLVEQTGFWFLRCPPRTAGRIRCVKSSLR